MKFAAIVPTSGLRAVERSGLGYHLVLAQQLLRDEHYRNYYKMLARLGHFVIVDNGAAERDQPSFERVVKVAEYVGASEIVMPDVVHDFEATIYNTTNDEWLALVPPRMRFIVPQGLNWDEVEWNLERLHTELDGQYATIGLSKYHWEFEGGRPEMLRRLRQPKWSAVLGTKHIHVLGIGADPFGEISELYDVYPGIRGVDTGAAVAWAQRSRPLPDPAWTGEHIPLVWDAPFDLHLAGRNIKALAQHAADPLKSSVRHMQGGE